MDHNEKKQARIRRAMIMRGKKMKTSYPCETNSVLCFSDGDKRSTYHFERTSITDPSFSSIIHPDYVNISNIYFPHQIRVGEHIIQDRNVLESLSWNANKDEEFSMVDKHLNDGANTRGPNHLGFCANHIVDEGSSIDYMQKKNARLKRSLIMREKRAKMQKHATYIDVDVDVDEKESQYNLDATDYWNLGDSTYACEFCGALFWYEERLEKDKRLTRPRYSICCMQGKVELPLLKDPPSTLNNLLHNKDSRSNHFLKKIRSYNMMFSFTSMGGQIDSTINQGGGPYVFKLHGQNCHMIGSLLPTQGSRPRFSQLYIYDTDNEVLNRISAISSSRSSDEFDPTIVNELKSMLDDCNCLAKSFRMARDRFVAEDYQDLKLRLLRKRGTDGRRYNLPTSSEVAALIVGDIEKNTVERDIVVETQTGLLQRIHELHPSYLPMQYPLLFPYGEDGYGDDIQIRGSNFFSSKKRRRVTMREYFAFRIQDRAGEAATILSSKRLFQQFVVDAYTMIESQRLSYIRSHQKNLRVEIYKGLSEAFLRGETSASSLGKRTILPSSFTGGARYMIQNYQDAMAICKWAGYPDLLITFTCNPKWPEMTKFTVDRGLKPEDRPDIMCRIFKIKLDELIRDLKKKQFFGKVKAVVYTIEFQKRGLPHAHILLFLNAEDKYPTGDDIDKIISAEIPNKHKHPVLYEAVQNFMIHGPCGISHKSSPCMKDGKCSKYFPKRFNSGTVIDDDGYPIYKRRDDGSTVEKNDVLLDNRFVVPYNPLLLIKYQAHINVEWCNQSRSIKYLFKYVNKGHDRVTAAFYQSTSESEHLQDEIKMYYDCRYVSPCEAVWRIFGFDINYREPPVERLSFHLQNEQTVVFDDDEPIDSIVGRTGNNQTMFLAWMEANKNFEEARNLTYGEFPTKFVWKKDLRSWRPRKRGFSIGRLYYIPPGSGELHYMRILLNFCKCPKSYEDIKTVNGVLYPSYKDACYALGLLDDDKEYIDGIKEASSWGSAHYLRRLFATMLFSNCLSRPEFIWDTIWHHLADDILHKQRTLLQHNTLQLKDDELKILTLAEIDKLLRSNGKSLAEFPPMPLPNEHLLLGARNKLLQDELCYDRNYMTREHKTLMSSLTDEQKSVYETIISAVSKNEGGVFFLYGYGGTGKTFIWRTLSAAIRSKGQIVLNVASSGIASLLLPGGRTAHSRFGIPLAITEESTCNIKQGSDLAELLIHTKLIIWDEAPMAHRFCFEALDRTLRDILRFSNSSSCEQPFGGKVVVFGGDFRQILPVIPKGTRQDIIFATINSSYLWSFVKVLTLTKNMRLETGSSNYNLEEMREFSKWILSVGDGEAGEENDGEEIIEIPDEFLIKESTNPIASIVDCTYPSLLSNIHDLQYLQERAILAPTLEIVDAVNEYMLSLLHGEEKIYLSSDSVCKTDVGLDGPEDVYTPDFLNSIKCSGVPNHMIKLKQAAPVMLLRNIDKSLGLCNGTRLMITQLGKHILEAKVISGSNIGEKVFIPRMVITPSDSKLPFKMQRRQFPLAVCFAMTINKSQGQSLSYVGLYLPRPIFSHGQLYVAISRVRNKDGLNILICDKDGLLSKTTSNVVFKEVFQNLK
ncbi:uncharacterized protein LOC109712000 isoform X3 [Ananas comosus]|uniref:ATP-dependent DNA helicase n=1 Tax=Ananas comosus TaxID=4615 RepID=A0A6P5FC22_ANACO|nr:uncharacterized protein LOC109712000 isoform X3 [Ananas comosus]